MSFTGKVLVVDDEAHIRKYVSLVMRALGATSIIEADNGVTGVELYQSENPDLVLLDVNMPVQEGIETLRQIRAFDPDAVVIMLTSLATRQMIDDAAQLGATYYLRKDTPRDELMAKLREVLASIFDEEPSAPDEAPGT